MGIQITQVEWTQTEIHPREEVLGHHRKGKYHNRQSVPEVQKKYKCTGKRKVGIDKMEISKHIERDLGVTDALLQHKDIHNITWVFPDCKTHNNQIMQCMCLKGSHTEMYSMFAVVGHPKQTVAIFYLKCN